MLSKPLRFAAIPVAQIIPHPDNPRRPADFKADNPKMQELIASIKSLDILEPLVATEHPQHAGKYLLVAGERRWHAAKHCRLATVPVVIHDLSEEEAFTAMLAENMQREDVDPIMEARVVAKMQTRGYNLEAVAAHFGKSYGWAQKRATIAGIHDGWLDLYEKQDAEADGADACSIEQLLLISRYDHATQARLLEDREHNAYRWGDTVASWRDRLAETLHELKHAPWEIADTTLVPAAGACNACPRRTSCQSNLWDDVGEGDRCTDEACWTAKTAAHVERRRGEVTAKYGQVVNITTSYSRDPAILGNYDYEKAKKNAPGAIPALVVEGSGAGTLAWITVAPRAAAKAKAAGAPGQEGGVTLEERRQGLEKRRTILAFRAVQEILATLTEHEVRGDEEAASERMGALPAGRRPNQASLIAWCHVYGVSAVHEYARYEQILRMSPEDLEDALWAVVAPQMRYSLQTEITARHDASVIPHRIAAAIGVDWTVLRAAADAAIPEPKAWRAQFPDAYAKAG
jgi:ParB/RepB/Spo0J family partition protein